MLNKFKFITFSGNKIAKNSILIEIRAYLQQNKGYTIEVKDKI